MGHFGIELKGLKELQDKLDINKLKDDLDAELATFAARVVEEAKQLAPVDEGFLKNQIGFSAIANGFEVVVACNYAAYVEFGTRKYAAEEVAKLPNDWKSFAAQYKGKGGGDYFQFLENILDWVLRKGIANRYSVQTQKAIPINLSKPGKGKVAQSDRDRLQQAAYLIARSIMKNGVHAHPFLFPAWEHQRVELFKRINQKIGPIKDA